MLNRVQSGALGKHDMQFAMLNFTHLVVIIMPRPTSTDLCHIVPYSKASCLHLPVQGSVSAAGPYLGRREQKSSQGPAVCLTEGLTHLMDRCAFGQRPAHLALLHCGTTWLQCCNNLCNVVCI